MKSRNLITLFSVLASLALLPAVHGAPASALPGFNTADGDHALFNVSSGVGNSGFGWYSLFANTTNSFNTALGAGTLTLATADDNTAVGAVALLLNSKGQANTAVGASALLSNDSTGNGFARFNSAFGVGAVRNNTDGDSNTAVGYGALGNNTAGSGSTAIGVNAGLGIVTANNVIAIGHPGADASDTTWIANIYGVTTISGTTAPVIVSNTGQLGTISSSARFKKDIADMGKSSEAILSLRPVTFHYKSDANAVAQFGLIAEEVEKVDPDLIIRDKEGKPYSVRYEAVNAMLLNEFLKAHKKVEQQAQQTQEQQSRIERQQATIAELKATVARQQREMGAFTAQLKEQAAQRRKVSAQLEVAKPETKLALTNQ